MTRDAMRTDRVIGMIQPSGGGAASGPTIYPIGCVGRITSFAETEDGRYLITLTGVCRFDVVEELRGRHALSPGGRELRALAAAISSRRRPRTACGRRWCGALRGYFEVYEISADWGQIEAAPLAGLVTSLAMICPFEPCEKQALLEAADPDAARRGADRAAADGRARRQGACRHAALRR